MRSSLKIFLLVILLNACSSPADKKQTGDEKPAVDSSTTVTKPADIPIPVAMVDGYKVVGDSLEIPAFQIELQLSDRAEQKLKSKNESVIVSAYYSGTPKDKRHLVGSGEFDLAGTTVELTDSRVANLQGVKMAKKDLDKVTSKDIDVLINVYSGRRSIADNILDVDFLQKPISEVKGQKFVLKGKLIGE